MSRRDGTAYTIVIQESAYCVDIAITLWIYVFVSARYRVNCDNCTVYFVHKPAPGINNAVKLIRLENFRRRFY